MFSARVALGLLLMSGCAVGQQSGSVSFTYASLGITQTINAGGINDIGQIVFNDGSSSFLRQPSGIVSPISGEPGAIMTTLHGINNSGQIVGTTANPTHAVFRNTDGTYTDLTGSFAFGINAGGQIVGTYAGSAAFITTGINASYQTFSCPGTPLSSQAMGINNLGQVVGTCGYSSGGPGSETESAFFRDTTGAIKILTQPGWISSEARGINDAGQIVGFFSDSTGQHGFFRNADGTVSVLRGYFAFGINNKGQILGTDGNFASAQYNGQLGAYIATISNRAGVLSHIAAGGGWTTEITLVNTSSAAVPATVALHNDDGSALTLPMTTTQQGVTQTTTSSSVNATMNPNTTLLISLGGQGASTVVGWADVLSSGSLGGYAIFRSTPQTGSPSEGTVPLASQFPSTITLPYDNTAGFVMGVALANLATTSASVTATIWDDSGNQLGTQSITIAGNGHTSFVLPTQISLTAGKRGIVRFQSATGGIAGLGLRFSPFGTFTSVPTL